MNDIADTPNNTITNPDQRNWHRLLGLFLTEFFDGSPYDVEVEKDLSVKKP